MQKQGTVRDVHKGNYLPSYEKPHRNVTQNSKWNFRKCSEENQHFFRKRSARSTSLE